MQAVNENPRSIFRFDKKKMCTQVFILLVEVVLSSILAVEMQTHYYGRPSSGVWDGIHGS